MSTHHQRLAKAHTGAIVHARKVWVPNWLGTRRSGGERTEGIVLAVGHSKDLVVFLRRRRPVQRWIPREALTPRKQREARAS